jgi:hypothetical protein
MRAANKEKIAVEDNQRRLRQERAEEGLVWEPGGGGFILVDSKKL